ncbi:hypothetical protein ACHAWF_002400 [Thalassiosira exigua]
MINRRALAIVLAAAVAVQDANAFAPSARQSIASRTLRSRPLFESAAEQPTEQLTAEAVAETGEASIPESEEKLIMDIPPSPVAPKKAPLKKKKGGNPHKEGLLSPLVLAAGAVLGEDQVNKLRAKVISLHSDLIKSFVGTADSAFGKAVLRGLFEIVDADDSGYLDKEEVGRALSLLGFKWLGEKQVNKIFERADANGDEEISLEEFMDEAPKTLKVNLIKLAKTNGGEMGLLV